MRKVPARILSMRRLMVLEADKDGEDRGSILEDGTGI